MILIHEHWNKPKNKDKYFMTPLIWDTWNRQTHWEVSRGVECGVGTGNDYLMGTKFPFSFPEKNLEMDNMDGCLTLCMYLMSLNCTLKHCENGQFYVMCILPHNTKTGIWVVWSGETSVVCGWQCKMSGSKPYKNRF